MFAMSNVEGSYPLSSWYSSRISNFPIMQFLVYDVERFQEHHCKIDKSEWLKWMNIDASTCTGTMNNRKNRNTE